MSLFKFDKIHKGNLDKNEYKTPNEKVDTIDQYNNDNIDDKNGSYLNYDNDKNYNDEENEMDNSREKNNKYDSRNEESIRNLDKFLYKKNIQILKVFKMKNRCILLLTLIKNLGKCVLLYIDPSKYQIECQYNNSIIGREDVLDIELFRINNRQVYENCNCFPELMKQTKDNKIDMENEKNKIYLYHFENICSRLNNFKEIVQKSHSKMGIVSEFTISFINEDNEIEMFIIKDTIPEKFSKMKIYLLYNLKYFMDNIDTVEFDIKKIVPKYIDELDKDNKNFKNSIESNCVVNNTECVTTLLSNLEKKKKSLKTDSEQLKKIFQVAKKNVQDIKNKRENVQQRFALETIKKTESDSMFLMMEIDDEYNNILSHSLNLINLIDKQCMSVNEYIDYLKKYCDFK